MKYLKMYLGGLMVMFILIFGFPLVLCLVVGPVLLAMFLHNMWTLLIYFIYMPFFIAYSAVR